MLRVLAWIFTAILLAGVTGLSVFTRIVTYYWSHDRFLAPGTMIAPLTRRHRAAPGRVVFRCIYLHR